MLQIGCTHRTSHSTQYIGFSVLGFHRFRRYPVKPVNTGGEMFQRESVLQRADGLLAKGFLNLTESWNAFWVLSCLRICTYLSWVDVKPFSGFFSIMYKHQTPLTLLIMDFDYNYLLESIQTCINGGDIPYLELDGVDRASILDWFVRCQSNS